MPDQHRPRSLNLRQGTQQSDYELTYRYQQLLDFLNSIEEMDGEGLECPNDGELGSNKWPH